MKIHFIGIGGIGVSALARYYLAQGHKVSGSDLVSSEITKKLQKLGVKIFIGKHKASTIKEIKPDLVVFSPAIEEKNPELKKAKELKIKCQSYPEALGELTKKHFTIAVCGSHGKSTVAAMVALILVKGGFNPTVILGTKLKEFGDSNFRMGVPSSVKHRTSNIEHLEQFLVIEADEYKESFLNYWPKIIVLLNIEYDHPDYFKNLKHYIKAYKKFVSHLSKDGFLVANRNDKNVYTQFCRVRKNIVWYSLKDKETQKLRKILKIPGEFNVSNALAALKVARILKIPDKISFKALSDYKGSWRRFEEKIVKIPNTKHKIRLINDYGHHPTQVRETLKAVREKFPKKKIWCIFQPHQYQRTYYLFDKFVKAFREVPIDRIIITDIYSVAGREKKEIRKKVNSKKLVRTVNRKNIIYLPKGKIFNYLNRNLEGGEVVILMGAGDIYEMNLKFAKN